MYLVTYLLVCLSTEVPTRECRARQINFHNLMGIFKKYNVGTFNFLG